MILSDGIVVGFVHLWYRGPNVAWIEDIYVDEAYRSRGIASSAIAQVEDMVKRNPNCTAICLDVVPRNENALRLYHKLGYDGIGIVTLRKELTGSGRDRKEKFLGLDFRV